MDFKSLINWYDLNDVVVIKLDKKFQKGLSQQLLQKARTIQSLAADLNSNYHQISLYKTCESNFSVGSLKKICKYLNLSPNDLNAHILEIGRKKKRIINPKLPFNLHTPSGAALRSIANSEGSLHPGKGTTMRIKVPEISMLEMSIGFANDIFGSSDIKILKTKDKNTHEIYLTSLIADCLKLTGVPGGKKSILNHHVPGDILNGPKELQRVYLGWSFACGMECASKVVKLCRYVDVTDLLDNEEMRLLHKGMNFKRDIPEAVQKRVAQRPPNLLIGEAVMLRNFGIDRPLYFASLWKSKNGRRVSAKWAVVISNFSYMNKLLEIGLPLPDKGKKLKAVIRSYLRLYKK